MYMDVSCFVAEIGFGIRVLSKQGRASSAGLIA